MITTLLIGEEDAEKRIDKLLSIKFPEYSRNYFQYLIEGGFVSSLGTILKKKDTLKIGQSLHIQFQNLPEPTTAPEDIPLSILYEDDEILAIDKPSGLVVHPGVGNPSGTVVNALMQYLKSLPETDDPLRPGIVHRLDKETSGILIAAKTRRAHIKLVDLFKARKMTKEYLAICERAPKKLYIEAPIGRNLKRRKEMAIVENGREAVTQFEILTEGKKGALVLAKPMTGRTHQIRVHLKHLNTPILGDTLYGFAQKKASRIMLHSYKLSFIHPFSGQNLSLTAPIPSDFKEILEKLSLLPENP